MPVIQFNTPPEGYSFQKQLRKNTYPPTEGGTELNISEENTEKPHMIEAGTLKYIYHLSA